MPRKVPRLIQARMDRRRIEVATFAEAEAADREFWAGQSVQSRLRALELMRRMIYGKAATGRLQRILEVVQSKAR